MMLATKSFQNIAVMTITRTIVTLQTHESLGKEVFDLSCFLKYNKFAKEKMRILAGKYLRIPLKRSWIMLLRFK